MGDQKSRGADSLSFIPPKLALVDKPRAGDSWFHDIKYDGYGTRIVIAGNQAGPYTRRGHHWTRRYRLLDATRELGGRNAHTDGELIVQDEEESCISMRSAARLCAAACDECDSPTLSPQARRQRYLSRPTSCATSHVNIFCQ